MWKLNNTGIAYTKKHKNDIIDIWNDDSKWIYKEFIENENLMKNIASIRREIEITSGIRQGCTRSTIFFKL